MPTVFRWILPLALLTSCSLSNEEQPGEVDSDVEAVLSVVLERMNAEGDSVVVATERACAERSRRSMYAQGDIFELVREGPGWRIIKVTGVWET